MTNEVFLRDEADAFYTVSSVSNVEVYHTSEDCRHINCSPHEVYERSVSFIEWHELPLCSRCRERMTDD